MRLRVSADEIGFAVRSQELRSPHWKQYRASFRGGQLIEQVPHLYAAMSAPQIMSTPVIREAYLPTPVSSG